MLADFDWSNPTVGGSSNTWGTEMNAILNILKLYPGIRGVADATARAALVPLLDQVVIQSDNGSIWQCTNATGPVWKQIDTLTGVMTTEGDLLYQGETAPARLAIGTTKKILRVNADGTGPEWASNTRGILFSFYNLTLTTALKLGFPVPCGLTITGGIIRCGTAPTGADIIVDIHKIPKDSVTSTTIFTTQANRPTIAAGANQGTIVAPDVVSFDQGDIAEAQIDQIGSTIVGADLTVDLYCEVTA